MCYRAIGSSKKQGGYIMSLEKQGGRNLEIDLANHDFEDRMDEIHQKQGGGCPPAP